MTRQTRIPCVLMRGGTSKGAYFLARDLPADAGLRDAVLLAAMGTDARQIDGVGGAHPLTSKVAIVAPSTRDDADVDYLFAQIVVGQSKVDVSPTCGNILSGVAPFAIEQGLVDAEAGETKVRIYMVNTKSLCTATVQTPNGDVAYDGTTAISGVPGAAAPILLDFENIAGSTCGALLPTGRVRDVIDGIAVTCIDNGMPVVCFAAKDVGRTGYESPAELNADTELKNRIEAIRLKAGPLMRLGDVARKVVPKMTLVAPPRDGGAIATRTFIPHVCHEAIGVLGAVSVATACALEGSAIDCAVLPAGDTKVISVEHPTGEFTVQLEVRPGADGIPGEMGIKRAALLRTARRLFDGNALVPHAVWGGPAAI